MGTENIHLWIAKEMEIKMKVIITFLVCLISFSALSEEAKANKEYKFNAAQLYNGRLIYGGDVSFVKSWEPEVDKTILIELQDMPENTDRCIAFGNAYASGERAYVDVKGISCLTPEKKVLTNMKDVKGFVTDDKYVLGLHGKYLDDLGLRTKVNQMLTDTLIDLAKNNKTDKEWSELFDIIKALDQLSPILEISPETPVKLFFADNVTLVHDSFNEKRQREERENQ